MEENVLIIEQKDYVCTITFNRPEQRNSLTPEQLGQLVGVLARLKADDQTRVLIFRGAGDKAFSSGYNIGQIPTRTAAQGSGEVAPNRPDALTPENPLPSALQAIRDFPYPTIAMIGGFCMGAGCELAATCDLRIASDDSRFAMPPAKLGVLYSPTGVQRFINLVGVAWTSYLFLSARTIDAQRAKEIGFVQDLVPKDQLGPVTYALAKEIAENAPLSVKGTKTLIGKLFSYQGLTDADRHAVEALSAQCFASDDMQEGRRAFLEKRKPRFQGR